MAMVPFGPWLPDQSDYSNPGATIAKNVIPRTAGSYAPLGSLSTVSNAMTNRAQGAAAFRDDDGNVHTFTGDATDLFKLNTTSLDFDEVTSSSAAMTVAEDDTVEFIQYGNRAIACNGHTDAIQSYVMGASTKFANLASGAPRARHLAVIKDFVFAGNTWDSTDGSKGNRVWWSAIDDPTSWPTIGTSAAAAVQSDRQDLPVGGWVQKITGALGGLDGAVFMEQAIYRIQYEGPPTVFGFYLVEEKRGTPAPNSVVNVGTHAFYLAEEGFFAFTGSGSTAIGDQKVNKWFFNELDQTYFNRIYGHSDPLNHVVFWAFPGAGSVNGTPNRLIMYNWSVDRWSYAEVDTELLFRDLTTGYTLEQLDAINSNLDLLTPSLDSRAWTGGRLILAAMDTSNKLARFTGANMEATMETAETGGPGMTMVNGIRVYVDGGTVTAGLKTRDLQTASEVLIGPNAIDADGQAHFNKTARYHRGQVVVAAGGTWSHAQGIEYDATPEGIV